MSEKDYKKKNQKYPIEDKYYYLYQKYKNKYLKLKELLGGAKTPRLSPSKVAGYDDTSKPYSLTIPRRPRLTLKVDNPFYLHMTLLSNLPTIISEGLGSRKQQGLGEEEYTYFTRNGHKTIITLYIDSLITHNAEDYYQKQTGDKDDYSKNPYFITIKEKLILTIAFITYRLTKDDNIEKHDSEMEDGSQEYRTKKIIDNSKIYKIQVFNYSNTDFDGSIKDEQTGLFIKPIRTLTFKRGMINPNMNRYLKLVNSYLDTNRKTYIDENKSIRLIT
jgi:hypothetical protein